VEQCISKLLDSFLTSPFLVVHPGTVKDIDFYFANVHDLYLTLPPDNQWNINPQRGVHPPPCVVPDKKRDILPAKHTKVLLERIKKLVNFMAEEVSVSSPLFVSIQCPPTFTAFNRNK
jgi:hypothetical protein